MKKKLCMLIIFLFTILINNSEAASYFTHVMGENSISAEIKKDSAVIIEFIEGSGYKFDGWSVEEGSADIDVDNIRTDFTMPNSNVTIRANYIEESNGIAKLVYDANGGSGAPAAEEQELMAEVQTYTFIISDIVPVREGYKFLGWATSKNASSAAYSGGKKITAANETITLYAVWQGTAVLVYNQNTTDTVTNMPVQPAAQNLVGTITNYTFVIDSVNPERTGYNFLGWALEANAQTATYSPGSTIIVGNETKTLYAVWKGKAILKYDANGGNGAPSDQTYDLVGGATSYTFTISSDKPTKTGYTFSKWNTKEDGTGTSYNSGATISVGNETVTLYAVWKAADVKYIVNHYLENANDTNYTLVSSKNKTAKTGTSIVLSNEIISEGDLNYEGKVKSASEVLLKENGVIKDTTTFATVKANGSLVINLYYTRETFEFGLQNNGITSLETTYKWGKEISINAQVAAGYAWNGWYYENGNLYSTVQSTTITMPTNAITLNAVSTLKDNGTATLVYNANNGSGAPGQESQSLKGTVTSYTFTVSSTVPTRAGYTFLGWSTSSSATSATYNGGNTISVGNESKTLYAVWQINNNGTATLVYNANNGSGAPGQESQSLKGTVTSYTFTVSSTVPTRAGYTFLGWSTNSSATSATYSGGNTVTLGNETVTLYAVWQLKNNGTATLAYNANSGSGAPGSQTQSLTGTVTSYTFTVSSTVPTRAGYTFLGWSTSSSATSATYSGGNTVTLGNETVTLYAVWQLKNNGTATLAYNANGGSGAPGSQTQSLTGTTTSYTFTVSSTKPTRTGYNFLGWSTNSSATSATYSGGNTISVGNETVTLYAIWTLNNNGTATLAYNANSGSGAPGSQTQSLTGTTTTYTFTVSSTKPTRAGYNFLGWSTNSSATSATYSGGNTIAVGNETVTLYAVWELKFNGTAKLVYYGGTPSEQSYELWGTITSHTFTISSITPTPANGYTFSKWNTNADGTGTNYNPGGSITVGNETVTLYPIWIENNNGTATLVYDKNTTDTVTNMPTSPVTQALTGATTTYTFTVSSTKPIRSGYTFLGWSTDSGATSATYSGGDTFWLGNQELTLYAVWRSNSTKCACANCTSTTLFGTTDYCVDCYGVLEFGSNSFDRDEVYGLCDGCNSCSLHCTIGDYVQYQPSEIAYVVEGTESGYMSGESTYGSSTTAYLGVAQTFYPARTTSWRIFDHTADSIEIISADSVGNLMLGYEKGYKNGVQVLQNIAAAYVNPEYAVSGRALGYNETGLTTEQIENYKSINSSTYPFNTYKNTFPYVDNQYQKDVSQYYSIYQEYPYAWLASRNHDTDSGGLRRGDGKYFSDLAWIYSGSITFQGGLYDNTNPVKTIVTLKPGTKLTQGNGSIDNPWIITEVVSVPQTYTISFEYDTHSTGETEIPTQIITAGDSITMPSDDDWSTALRFLGWGDDPGAANATYVAGQTITPTADMRLFAIYGNKTYTMSYDAKGGTGEMVSQSVSGGSAITLRTNAFTKSGYTFKGWDTSSNATTVVYADGATFIPTSSKTLYAVWGKEEIPTMIAKDGWYTSSTNKTTLTQINIQNSAYTGAYTENPWAADDDGSGDIMCYINGTTLTIAGNGSSKIYANADSWHMFSGFTSVTNINGLGFIDTSNVTRMSGMFSFGNNLTSLDLSSFNTSNVTDMSSMFLDCNSLTSLNLSSFNTSNVTNMSGMFGICSKLISINLGSFNTSNVTDMSSMFLKCDKLISLDLSNFDTSNVTDMGSMFSCSSLVSLNLSSFNTKKVTDMDNLFGVSYSLREITLGKDFAFVGTSSYLPAQYVAIWYTVDGTGYTASQLARTTRTEATTYYATLPSRTVTYDSNGGNGTMSAQTVTSGGTLTLSANTFTKSGYAFLGWSENSSATSATYTDGQNVKVVADMKLYAVWTQGTETYCQYCLKTTLHDESLPACGHSAILICRECKFGWCDECIDFSLDSKVACLCCGRAVYEESSFCEDCLISGGAYTCQMCDTVVYCNSHSIDSALSCGTCSAQCCSDYGCGECYYYDCYHEWDSGYCLICGMSCEHSWYEGGYCDICYMDCAHEWEGGCCLICSYSCSPCVEGDVVYVSSGSDTHHIITMCAVCGGTIETEEDVPCEWEGGCCLYCGNEGP